MSKKRRRPTESPGQPALKAVLDFRKIQKVLDNREGFESSLKKQQARERKLPGKDVRSVSD
jgi:hypothetical protein